MELTPVLRSREIHSASVRRSRFAGAVSRRKMPSTSTEMRLKRLDFESYSVEIGENRHRVLTLCTDSPMTATNWLKDVSKTVNTKHQVLILGISVDEPKDRPWEKIVQICTGSHCLLLMLPQKDMVEYGYTSVLKAMKELFGSSHVFAVAEADPEAGSGMKMGSVKALNEEYGIAISNPVEVVGAAKFSQKAKEIGIGYWPPTGSNAPWYDNWRSIMLTDQKVMYSALKSYLCFLMGNEYLDEIKPPYFPSTSAKKKKKKKKKN